MSCACTSEFRAGQPWRRPDIHAFLPCPAARAPRPRAAALRQLFGLTAAEAALTEALAAGSDLREIAEARRITYATLRAQLRSVMAKTGTRRQGELIALAHRTAALDLGGEGSA